jgi:hypothetical protein
LSGHWTRQHKRSLERDIAASCAVITISVREKERNPERSDRERAKLGAVGLKENGGIVRSVAAIVPEEALGGLQGVLGREVFVLGQLFQVHR